LIIDCYQIVQGKIDFILAISGITFPDRSILSLLSVIRGRIGERIFINVVIYRAILNNSDGESVIKWVALAENHGKQIVENIVADLLRLGIAVLVNFIKELVIHGRLNDLHRDFLVARNDSKGETWD
jgi:hypothetical protein